MDHQQMHPMIPRRHGFDTSSHYSGSTNSIWSTSDSVSFVYTDDPYWSWWGYDGVRGAVTRKSDKRDDRRTRVAAHFLRGPFAAHKSKKYHRDSDTRSNYSSSSMSSSSSRGSRVYQRPQPPMDMPPGPFPGSLQQQPHPQHFGSFAQPPPPPPPHAMPGPPAGFEAGFIQLGGGGGGGGGHNYHQHHEDPVWGTDAEYDAETEPEVWE